MDVCVRKMRVRVLGSCIKTLGIVGDVSGRGSVKGLLLTTMTALAPATDLISPSGLGEAAFWSPVAPTASLPPGKFSTAGATSRGLVC